MNPIYSTIILIGIFGTAFSSVDIETTTKETTKEVIKEDSTIFFTAYNPAKGQTDNSPCIGAAGKDLCVLSKNDVRPIALDRSFIARWGGEYKYGDKIILSTVPGTPGHGDSRCNGVFTLLDTMNKRYTGKNRGDIFFMDKGMNISCMATIRKA